MANASLTYREGDEPIPGYKLTKKLGQGGVGETWRATAPGGIEVALKVVSKLQEGGGRRELQGLEQIKNIRHNHLCQTYGYWAKNAAGEIVEAASGTVSNTMSDTIIPESEPTGAIQLLIAMELGEETLADVYARYRQQRSAGELGGIPVDELFRYIESAGRAVDHLNQRHICHCDLKPANILLVGGEAKVCDFGLARQVVDAKKTTSPAYTPQYGAPEMMVGATYDKRMDQYSLALTYAELRAGRFPFPSFTRVTSESQLGALAREKWEGRYDLSALPKAERKVIAKAMSPDPEDRYETIEDMLDALQEAIYPAERSGWLTKAVLGFLLIGIVSGAFLMFRLYGNGGPPPPPPPPPPTDILNVAADSLAEFDKDRTSSHLDHAMTLIQQVLRQEQGSPRAAALERQCLDRYFGLAGESLRKQDAKATRSGLAPIELHLKEFHDASRQSYQARLAFYLAWEAAEGAWQGASQNAWRDVQNRLDSVRSGAGALSPEEREWWLPLLTACATKVLNPPMLARREGLINLKALREAAPDGASEKRQEVLAAGAKQALVSWASLSSEEQRLVKELWGDDIELSVMLADALEQAGLGNVTKVRDLLPKLRGMVKEKPREEWEVNFLTVLVDLKSPEGEPSLGDVLKRLGELLKNPPPDGSLHHPSELFEVLTSRMEGGLEAGTIDVAAMQAAWELWGQLRTDEGERGAALDRRLRVLAVIAQLAVDPPNDQLLEQLAQPLVEWLRSGASGDGGKQTAGSDPVRERMPLVVAAWVECLLVREGRQAELGDEGGQKVVLAALRGVPPGKLYQDYHNFVRALDLDRLQEKCRDAANLLLESGSPADPSPPMRVARRRQLAGEILVKAVREMQQRKADGLLVKPFSSAEEAAWAWRCVELIRTLWKNSPPTETRKLDLAEQLVLVSAAAERDPQEWVQYVEPLLKDRKTGPLLVAWVQGAARIVEANPGDGEARNQTLRAYRDLLVWLDGHPEASRFQEQRDAYFDKALALLEKLPLMQELKKLDSAALIDQLLDPKDPLLREIKSIRDRPGLAAAVADLYGLVAQRLLRSDNSKAGVLKRLQARAVAAWLMPDRAEFLVSLGETVESVSDLDSETRLKLVESLANRADRVAPGFPAANALQAYVAVLQARRAGDSPAAREQLDKAIERFEKALAGPALGTARARYLVRLSTALVERAFLVQDDGGKKALVERQDLLKRARTAAKNAADPALDSDEPPEDALVAKGHAEEDLAYYVGDVKEYLEASKSFTAAVNAARSGRRSEAVPRLARGRCLFRQLTEDYTSRTISYPDLQKKIDEEALVDLQAVIDSETPAERRAEAHFWIGSVFLFLADMPERNRRDDLKRADEECANAEKIAREASLPDWCKYQMLRIRTAESLVSAGTADSEIVKERSGELLEAARDPVRGKAIPAAYEYEALINHCSALLTLKEEGIEAVRKAVDQALVRFPTDDAQRLPFHARLRAQRSDWIIKTESPSEEPESLFQQAGKDAETAVQLAAEYAKQGGVEPERVLALAHAALGLFYDRMFTHLASSKRAEALAAGRKASEELVAARHHYDNYYQNCLRRDVSQELVDRKDCHLQLGLVNLDLLTVYSGKLTAGEPAALKEQGKGALTFLQQHVERFPPGAQKQILDALDRYSKLP